MGCTLVIDTSFGSTVGIVGREPIVETDSRTHVEKLQVNIARAVEEAGLTPADIEEIVVGIGPAPFTGLRAGIVAAKALAFATGAKLVGQNVLDPQGEMMNFVLGDSAMFDGIDFLADVPCADHHATGVGVVADQVEIGRASCRERVLRLV